MSGSLGGVAISRARVQLSAWGLHWADVDLADSHDFAKGDLVDLVVLDATLKGAIIDGGTHESKSSYRWAGGRGKWPAVVAAKGYANDAGVKASLVLGDAAAACGETIADLPTTRLGPHYARRNAPAVDVLHSVSPRNWYVDFAGVTRIGARPSTTYAGSAPRTRVSPNGQIVELAVEDSIASLVPGVIVDGMKPATDVEWTLEPSRLTVRVWGGGAPTTRRLSALQKIVEAFTARERYAGAWEYRVVIQTGERFTLQPVRVANGLPDLANVPVRPGVAGMRNNVTLGELVLVQFIDKDPSRPCITNHGAPDAPGWMPLTIELGGPGALGVARITDLVVAGPYGGAITTASARVKAVL